jgi:Uma2 family endonuclease
MTALGQAAVGQRLRLDDVSWQTYEKLLDALGDRPLRLTYDRGSLEIMILSWGHEWWKRRFGLVIDLLGAELGLDIQGGGSTTFKRADLERGLEPDECYYVLHEAAIRGKTEIDLSTDPPPDLAVEIDITRSSLDRMSIYAALGVPELWRFDGDVLQLYHLVEGHYELAGHSLSFPSVPMDALVDFLRGSPGMSESALIRSFRTWIPAHVSLGPEQESTGAP